MYGLGENYYMMYKRFKCKCGRTFSSIDPGVVANLPPEGRNQLPVRVYNQVLIDWKLEEHLQREAVRKKSFSDIRRLLQEMRY